MSITPGLGHRIAPDEAGSTCPLDSAAEVVSKYLPHQGQIVPSGPQETLNTTGGL